MLLWRNIAEYQAMYLDAVFCASAALLCRGGGMAWLKAREQQPAFDLHYTLLAIPSTIALHLP